MAFCKICDCGNKIVFETVMGYPDICPNCKRELSEFTTYDEKDPFVKELMEKEGNKEEIFGDSVEEKKTTGYVLKLNNGKEIKIPAEGCVIGRTETGAEELAEYKSVSRQHLRITPKRNVGVIVEDLSTYGTLVDGRRLEKNVPVRITEGAKVTLCDIETILMIAEG